MKMYSIKDVEAELFGKPFDQLHEIIAKRTFTRLLQQADGLMKGNEKHFELWQLGEFDQKEGILKEDKKIIMKGKDHEKLD